MQTLPLAPNQTHTQSHAKKHFTALCLESIEKYDRARFFVQDKSGARYMTLDPKERHIDGPAIEISARYFKDNFSNFSNLIKTGMCFKLKLADTKKLIFARKHTSYIYPLEKIIIKWQDAVVNHKFLDVIEDNFDNLNNSNDGKNNEIITDLKLIKRAIARMAIGHKPFEEGLIKGLPRVDDEEYPI